MVPGYPVVGQTNMCTGIVCIVTCIKHNTFGTSTDTCTVDLLTDGAGAMRKYIH